MHAFFAPEEAPRAKCHEVIGLIINLNHNLTPCACMTLSKLIVAFIQPCIIVIVISK